jgi:AcrR family transcriptional regulator
MFCMSEADAVPGSACGPAVPPAATRRGRTPSADVERELLAAAEAVLIREGPGGLTVRAVATEAGIAPMGVYNRLGGKDGLVAALLIRFFDAGRRYREFALANPHFYAIMFEDAIPHEFDNPEVAEHAIAAFQALVRIVEFSAASGVIAAPDLTEVAQQIWSTIHGAVALELKGLIQTEDPAATYRALLGTIFRGLAPR